MKRQPQFSFKHAVRVSIWLLAGIFAVCALWTSKRVDAEEWSGSEVSDETYFEEPEMAAEIGTEEHAEVEQSNGHGGGAGCQCHSESCSKCCKKGKCAGVCLDPGHPAKPKHKKPGDIDEGDCPSIRYRMDDRLRSGDPNCVYKWAKPSITEKYSAWYVGGGAWFKGRGRTAEEGTWGLDYDGAFGHARTWLNYTCGKRQGGEGAYETDHVPLKKKF